MIGIEVTGVVGVFKLRFTFVLTFEPICVGAVVSAVVDEVAGTEVEVD